MYARIIEDLPPSLVLTNMNILRKIFDNNHLMHVSDCWVVPENGLRVRAVVARDLLRSNIVKC